MTRVISAVRSTEQTCGPHRAVCGLCLGYREKAIAGASRPFLGPSSSTRFSSLFLLSSTKWIYSKVVSRISGLGWDTGTHTHSLVSLSVALLGGSGNAWRDDRDTSGEEYSRVAGSLPASSFLPLFLLEGQDGETRRRFWNRQARLAWLGFAHDDPGETRR